LQHFPHKGNELLLLFAFQSLIHALQAYIRYWCQIFPSACFTALEGYSSRRRIGISILPH
jgi:hypothetical protein